MPRSTASQRDALRFFDPALADTEGGCELLQLLLGGAADGEAVEVDDGAWDVVLGRVVHHRLLPQLIDAARAGMVVVPPRVLGELNRADGALAIQELQLRQLLHTLATTLGDAGVPFLVLKGAATAHLDHVRPSARQAVDVDVLVRPEDFERTAVALNRTNLVSEHHIPRLGDLSKGDTWSHPSGWAVDVHTRPHALGGTPSERWWREADVFELAGRRLTTWRRGARLAHAASHLAISPPAGRRLSSLLDIHVISSLADEPERAAAEDLLDEIGVADLVQRITARAAGVTGRRGAVLGHRSRRPRALLLAHTYDHATHRKFATKIAVATGVPWRQRVDLVKTWVAPSPEYLARGGYTNRIDRWRELPKRIRER